MAQSSSNIEALDDLTELMAGEATLASRRGSSTMPKPTLRTSNVPDYWNHAEARLRTPPPPLFGHTSSISTNDDLSMDTPVSLTHSISHTRTSSPSRSSTSQPTAPEGARKTLGKRRRDDDLDPYLLKRRAVSPGVSHQSSPVLPPSPAQRDSNFWSQRQSAESTQRSGSNGSQSISSGNVGKIVGLKGMNDTNDGIMNMSIE